MKKNLYFSLLFYFFSALILLLNVDPAEAQVTSTTGYIYIHKNASDEVSSPNFTFNVSGGSFNQNYTLNDQHAINAVKDIGGTNDGGLVALMGTATDNPIYYRAPNSSTWQFVGGGGVRIDGGPGNTHVHSNSSGGVFYYNGTSYVNMNVSNAGEVAFDKWNNEIYMVAAGGRVFRRPVTTGASWTGLATGVAAASMDIAPTREVVYSSTNSTNPNVFISDYQGNNIRNLGDPGNTGTQPEDVAVGDDGVIYATKITADGIRTYRYTGGNATGGSWVLEPSSRGAWRITGGANGQMWNSGFDQRNIFTRTADGFWIDDEPVKTTASNSVMIPVPAGTYTVTEDAVSGWALGSIDVYDPTNNTTSNISARTSTVNVANGEVVHLVYKNQFVQTFTVANNCTSAAYVETFGSGNEPTVGPALVGQTNYHYYGVQGGTIQDGYYTIASNTVQPGFGPKGGNFKDHTTGNGTGRMMLINASYDKGIFFTRRFNGLLPGVSYSFSAWVMNISNTIIKPNVLLQVIDPATGTVLASQSTGDITSFGQWQQSQLLFTAGAIGEVDLVLTNNNIGGEGNDLALDDISFGLAKPNQPTVAVGNCLSGTTRQLSVTSPLGSQYVYSIDGTNYQTSPNFTVSSGTYPVTVRYSGSVGGCATTPVSQTVDASACASTPTGYLAGTVFHDINGGNVNNSTGGANTVPAGLYANLINASGNVAAVVPVNADGTYQFSGAAPGTYTVVLSTTSGTVGSAAPAPGLPSGWVNTGEYNGTPNTGNDGTPNGISAPFTVAAGTTTSNINFGIQQPPVADPKSFTLAATPASNSTINLNAGGNASTGATPGNLTGNDPDGGILNSTSPTPYGVTINTLPTNGTLIYDGTPITSTGFAIPAYDPTKLQFQFTGTGYNQTSFTYSVIDQAGTASAPATYSMSWTDPISSTSIAGTVFHDPNGGNVNNSTGGANTVPAGLYANLINSSGNVAAVVPVNADGTYQFSGAAPGTYTVVLSTTSSTVGSAAPAPGLPSGWVNTGEFNGTPDTGTDGTPNGISAPFTVVANTATSNINFGIQQPPVADAKSFTLASTPASNSTINLNAGGDVNSGATPGNLTGNDPDGGILNSTSVTPYGVTINTLPTNGTLIYDGTPITTAGFTIPAYDPADLQFQFTGTGYTNTSFTYSVQDAAGSSSAPATYSMSWADPVASTLVSGNVFHDPNGGNVNNSTGGANTVPAGLYANLVDASGNVAGVVPVNADGTYTFTGAAAGTYTVVLSTTSGTVGTAAPAASLPTDWVNTGEYNGTPNTGNDGTPNGISAPFTVAAGTTTSNINFGIERTPQTNDVNGTLAEQPSPNQEVPLDGSIPTVPLMSGSDPEDGTYTGPAGTVASPKGVVIRSLPTYGELWYFGFGVPVQVAALDLTNSTLFPDPSLFTLILTGSDYTSTSFQYAYVDQAGVADPTPATYTLSWGGALPVRLVSFTAVAEYTQVNLNWTTATEVNNSGFEIQRSTNGTEWRTLGFVKSNVASGNTQETQNYRFMDTTPLHGSNYYRLKQIDLNGKFEYSRIRSVTVENVRTQISTYPNPVQDILTVNGLTGFETIKIHDLSGRVMAESKNDTQESSKTFSLKSLISGVYVINIHTLDGKLISQKVVKTN